MLSYAGGALGLAGSLGGSLGYVPRARAQSSPPTPGGTLVVAGEAIGDNFGPAVSFQGWAHVWVVQNVFESLYTTRDFKTLIPSLATSYTVSDDGRIYTFQLAQGRQVPRRDAVQRRGRRVQLHALPRQEPPLLRAGRRPGHLPGHAAAGREVRERDRRAYRPDRPDQSDDGVPRPPLHELRRHHEPDLDQEVRRPGCRPLPGRDRPVRLREGREGEPGLHGGVRRLLGRPTLPRPGGRARDLGRADDDGQPAVGRGRPDPLHRLQGSGLLPEEPEPEGLTPSRRPRPGTWPSTSCIRP